MVKRQRKLIHDLAEIVRSYLAGKPTPDKAQAALRKFDEQFPPAPAPAKPTHKVCPCGNSHS